MTYKKVLIPVGILLGACIGVYFTYFHRPPTSDILAANRQRREHIPDMAGPGMSKLDDDYEYSDGEDDDDVTDFGEGPEAAKLSARRWLKFMDANDLVSIGELYDRCEGDSKIMLGKVAMVPDPVRGGIMARTYLNTTLKKEVSGGEMYIECSYNGKELYSNHWDLCTVEEGMDDRIIFCPIGVGKQKFVKNLEIPSYLPKGRYTTKAWLTNQDEDILGCAFSDFTI
ncbi:hypothetical protein CAPTEDRAFT_221728 [Capitella teleta]|uniref:MD-2-related lipid-recognition domain-containing protein n=1 Tax=Capitella teleta TaxID=283909 RepID=R7V4U8_CAPTE|nr:hypothetical protein CAPTEDRAFT_221728 [Capitella teleta]|eukprot:ELU11386.1 hypothetical protein CAPTEDRAFT_221728 [Capitella teleta]